MLKLLLFMAYYLDDRIIMALQIVITDFPTELISERILPMDFRLQKVKDSVWWPNTAWKQIHEQNRRHCSNTLAPHVPIYIEPRLAVTSSSWNASLTSSTTWTLFSERKSKLRIKKRHFLYQASVRALHVFHIFIATIYVTTTSNC